MCVCGFFSYLQPSLHINLGAGFGEFVCLGGMCRRQTTHWLNIPQKTTCSVLTSMQIVTTRHHTNFAPGSCKAKDHLMSNPTSSDVCVLICPVQGDEQKHSGLQCIFTIGFRTSELVWCLLTVSCTILAPFKSCLRVSFRVTVGFDPKVSALS